MWTEKEMVMELVVGGLVGKAGWRGREGKFALRVGLGRAMLKASVGRCLFRGGANVTVEGHMR